MSFGGMFGGGMFGGGGGGGAGPGEFSMKFNVYPPSFLETDRPQVEEGDKIIMPASCLDMLARLRISYPMLFEVTNEAAGGRKTHCGVLEFVAPEGKIFLPHWMMQNLYLEPGDVVRIRSVTMAKGTHVKLRPQSSDFIKLANPKAVLENKLRSFSALTTGDTIVVKHAGKQYAIDIREVRPGNAVTIIETDINVDFEAPLDHEDGLMGAAAKAKRAQAQSAAAPSAPEPEPTAAEAAAAAAEAAKEANSFKAFKGQAYSLSGKSAPSVGRPGDVKTYAPAVKPIDKCKGGMATPENASEKGTVPSSFTLDSMVDSSDEESTASYEGKSYHVFGGTGWR